MSQVESVTGFRKVNSTIGNNTCSLHVNNLEMDIQFYTTILSLSSCATNDMGYC